MRQKKIEGNSEREIYREEGVGERGGGERNRPPRAQTPVLLTTGSGRD